MWLDEVTIDQLAEVGGKNASLGETLHARVRIPPSFAVTTGTLSEIYNCFLKAVLWKKRSVLLNDVVLQGGMNHGWYYIFWNLCPSLPAKEG